MRGEERAERLRKEKLRLEQELEALNDAAVESEERINQDVVDQLPKLNCANNQRICDSKINARSEKVSKSSLEYNEDSF